GFASHRHCGVLWTSHNMYEVEDVCDRVLLLSRGKILLEGDPKTLPRQHGKETLEELFIAVARESLRREQAPSYFDIFILSAGVPRACCLYLRGWQSTWCCGDSSRNISTL